MLAIKLKRVGKKHQATFRIIVAERRKKIEGKFVEDLGFWDPHANKFSINGESAKKWMGHGAQPTASVHNLLVKAKVIVEEKKIQLHKKPVKKAEAK